MSISKIWLIVLNFESYEETISFIDRIEKQDCDLSLGTLIVDNCSSNNSYNILKERFVDHKNIEIIKTDKNGGYAYGNNYGAKYLTEKYNPKYLIISNPDVYFDVSVIEKMVQTLRDDPEAAIVSVQMKDKDKNNLNSAWKLPTLIDDIILSVSIFHKMFGNPVVYTGKYSKSYVDVVQGAFFLIRAKVFKEIGFMDERTFMYCEERILGKKLKDHGYKSIFLPQYYFCHDVGKTINEIFPKKLNKYRLLQNSRRIYHKYYLNQNIFKLIIFDLVTFIGSVEKLFSIFNNKDI